ncbi:MAG: type II toxin-antitoxin system RelE/ParE family toxin [Desulfobacterales bacterium]|nr:type II toxin-antitoxin system RelE/ParE family toxin [Desulfobacterales bacterium]
MKQIFETEVYSNWFDRLRDNKAKAVINARLRRIELGNFGDFKSVGEGVLELRIQFGPGYRIYITQRDFEVVILLAGGDKSTQSKDIKMAIELSRKI